jgi:hypothetical protein
VAAIFLSSFASAAGGGRELISDPEPELLDNPAASTATGSITAAASVHAPTAGSTSVAPAPVASAAVGAFIGDSAAAALAVGPRISAAAAVADEEDDE